MSTPVTPNPSPAPDPAAAGSQQAVHHEPQARKNKRPERISELNLTSMLDVCFQLLIFFVLTSNFAVGEGILPANMPVGQGAKSDDTEPPEQPITILLRSLGSDDLSIEIQGSPVAIGRDFAELHKTLASLQNNPSNPNGIYNKDDPVVIQPQGAVAWGAVVDAFNAAVRAKYENVAFSQPQKD